MSRLHPPARARPAALALAATLAACGGGRPAAVGPIADPAGAAGRLEGGTRLEEPMRIDFEWSLNESGARLRGRGVARVEPPYRARLDLFLDENLERVVTAAVVDGELRLPPGSREELLPPVDLMWATLGVYRPGDGARLLGGDRLDDGGERLRFRQPDGRELHLDLDREGRLVRADVVEGGFVVEQVRLAVDVEDHHPREAIYRNNVDFRELKITRTSLRASEPFDSEIWDPRGP